MPEASETTQDYFDLIEACAGKVAVGKPVLSTWMEFWQGRIDAAHDAVDNAFRDAEDVEPAQQNESQSQDMVSALGALAREVLMAAAFYGQVGDPAIDEATALHDTLVGELREM